MSTALIGWLLYSIDGAALAEGLSQASLLSMSAAFVVMLALSLVGVFTKVRWSPRWD
jgi:membrane protein implicated in regulation of membrane protease activity